jgi:hypothetical protein
MSDRRLRAASDSQSRVAVAVHLRVVDVHARRAATSRHREQIPV